MMISSRRNSRGQAPRGLLIVSIIAIAAVALDALLGGPGKALVRAGAGAAWGGVASAASALDASGLFASKARLAEENIALRAQVADLQSLATENRLLAEQNASLRSLADATASSSGRITVPVLSNESASPYGTFVIGGGTSDGVFKGAFVEAPGDVLLGVVSDAQAHTALVDIFLSPGRQTTGLVGTSTTASVTGRGGGNGVMRIPRDTPLSVGDPVYYGAKQAIIGTVGDIESDPSDAEKTVYLRVPLNLSSLPFVSVVPSGL
ncbi:MAG TPA: rod shape-determining protein MreC [Candidatus Paceibacterota bacterium]|nr:rod shape-determining protein MreC [Candidatus Paceibacterota bacterium]